MYVAAHGLGFGTWIDGGRHCRLHNPESTTGKSAILFFGNWTSLKPDKPRPESNKQHEGYPGEGDVPELASLLRPLFCCSIERAGKEILDEMEKRAQSFPIVKNPRHMALWLLH